MSLALKGRVDRDIAALFIETLAAVSREDGPLEIDMEEADIEDAVVAAMLIEHLREAAQRAGSLILLRPPQVLAHGLYRVGALGASLQVIEPRLVSGAT